ncbi:MAG: hypothetical protein EOM76_03740 [Sphingobacteriia bacterium]|jgi:hypothetical protein|nr:hypothetical protein [Paludibacteraceae bacterium]NCA79286.1 hypothetical protein [Sphingobacteriia bacterium]
MEREKEITPNLDAIGNTMPFDVPDGYFDDVTKRIIAQTATTAVKQKTIRHWIYAVSACAIIAAFAGAVLFTVRQEQNSEYPLQEDYYNQIINEGVSEDLLMEHILANE